VQTFSRFGGRSHSANDETAATCKDARFMVEARKNARVLTESVA